MINFDKSIIKMHFKRLLVLILVIVYFNLERSLGPYNGTCLNLVAVNQRLVMCPMLFL